MNSVLFSPCSKHYEKEILYNNIIFRFSLNIKKFKYIVILNIILNSNIQNRLDSAQKLITQLDTCPTNIHENKDIINKVDIAHALEDLKSIPDYMMRILLDNEKIHTDNTHFPLYKKSKSNFKRFMSRNYKELKLTNKLYIKLESVQYYNNKSTNNWMKDLTELANPVKHSTLSKIDSKKSEVVFVHDNYGDTVIRVGPKGRYAGGGRIDIGNKKLILPKIISTETITKEFDHPNIKNIEYAEWKFEKNDKIVSECLCEIHIGIISLLKIFGLM